MKSNRFYRLLALGMAGMLVAFGAACGGGGGSSSNSSGNLALYLTDAFDETYQAVYVTIGEIQVSQVHEDDQTETDSWLTVARPRATYNLLELVNGVRQSLGIAYLEPGRYSQMRLIIGTEPDNGTNIFSAAHPFANYVIDEAGHYHALKVPSGLQTGVKIIQGFDISLNGTTELILDFDAARSVVKAGSSGQWLLKPTIKILNTEEYSIINGEVTDADASEPAGGVVVSAQVYNPGAGDPKDAVTVRAATVTDAEGNYALFVQPGTYNLVAYLDDFAPTETGLVTQSGGNYSRSFEITGTDTGTVTGNVSIPGGDEDRYGVLSFRQTVTIDGSETQVEIKSVSVGGGGTYTVILPEGSYSLVASSYGLTTRVYDIDINQGSQTVRNVAF
ncbi:MAG TPA: DUF4382 domain-containing protein [bacterium]|uniref:DUF4382 domain-containing protein n=1 Tax=candidate division TA06 bacterium ADurb.Bin417 TaxID=1852828 RepID=A0A1V5MEL9_UNCT6|nr:MAG: hypothetical protein BWY73_01032 [candidate division TA06 bacterium ADurb.Bin417]HNQ35260.1 DUF4382 domain-containing protein [bacterium]